MPLNDSYENIYERANMLVSENRWEQAIDEYKRIFNRLGKLGPDARARHPELLEIFMRACFEMTSLLTRMDEYDQAIEIMQQIIVYEPDTETLWRREIARCHIQQGKTEQGISELEALANGQDDPFTAFTLGEVYYNLKDYDRAIAQLTRAIQLASSQNIPQVLSLAYGFLFNAHAKAGNVAEAIRVWQMSDPLDESPGINWRSVYDLYLAHGDMDGARAVLMRDRSPLRKGLYRGLISLREGDPDEARQQWEKVVRRDIDAESMHIDCWIEACVRVGQASRAIEQVLPLLSEGQVNLHTSILLSIAWAALGETERADSLLGASREVFLWKRNGQLLFQDWELLDELIPDAAVKSALRYHFAGAEETAGSPAVSVVDGAGDAADSSAESVAPTD